MKKEEEKKGTGKKEKKRKKKACAGGGALIRQAVCAHCSPQLLELQAMTPLVRIGGILFD